MRRVKVFKWERAEGKSHYEKKFDYEGLFHQIGTDADGDGTGVGTYSTAIVEKEDGFLKNVRIEMIQFIDKVKG